LPNASALAIDRNYATAHLWIGVAKFLAGRNEETEAHILEAFRTSPRDISANRYALIPGIAKCLSGRDEEAVVWLSRSIELRPNVSSAHFYLAAALARLGRLGEARAGLELNPGFTIARFRSSALSDHPAYLAGRERVYDGLRKGGCRRSEANLKAACGSGCDARRLSTGRSIRA
jgi:tetratricopeptide (TPR) repeat protein